MTAFWTALLCAPGKINTDIGGLLKGLHRGEMKCIGPEAKETDVLIKIRREIEKVLDRDIRYDVKHVLAHRT